MKQQLSNTIKAVLAANKHFIQSQSQIQPQPTVNPLYKQDSSGENTQPDLEIEIPQYTEQYFGTISGSQAPQVLWYGCSDSRTPVEVVAQLPLNYVFSSRNIANIVRENDPGTMGILDFSVKVLGIRSVVVCGHTNCGGVISSIHLAKFQDKPQDIDNSHKKKMEDGAGLGDGGKGYGSGLPRSLCTWLKPVLDVHAKYQQEIDQCESSALSAIKLAKLNVISSIDAINSHLKIHHPTIAREVCVAGLFLDLSTGLLSPI